MNFNEVHISFGNRSDKFIITWIFYLFLGKWLVWSVQWFGIVFVPFYLLFGKNFMKYFYYLGIPLTTLLKPRYFIYSQESGQYSSTVPRLTVPTGFLPLYVIWYLEIVITFTVSIGIDFDEHNWDIVIWVSKIFHNKTIYLVLIMKLFFLEIL